VKYSSESHVSESVSDLSTTEVIRHRFDDEDKKIFAFVFQPVKDTDDYFYRDVLHPSVQGDALHLAMRTRDEASRKTWIFNCSFHANSVYCHFLLQFAKTGKVPDYMKERVKEQAAKCIRWQKTLLQHPQWIRYRRISIDLTLCVPSAGLCRDRVAWLGFTTTYKTAGTAKLRGSRTRHRVLWVGLWVGKSPGTLGLPHLRFPEPRFWTATGCLEATQYKILSATSGVAYAEACHLSHS